MADEKSVLLLDAHPAIILDVGHKYLMVFQDDLRYQAVET